MRRCRPPPTASAPSSAADLSAERPQQHDAADNPRRRAAWNINGDYIVRERATSRLFCPAVPPTAPSTTALSRSRRRGASSRTSRSSRTEPAARCGGHSTSRRPARLDGDRGGPRGRSRERVAPGWVGRHAEGHDGAATGAWACSVDDTKPPIEQAGETQEVFSGQLGGPMAALGPLIGERLGVERALDRRCVRRGPAPQRADRRRGGLRDRGHRAVRYRDRRARAGRRDVPSRTGRNSAVAEATRTNINAFGIEYEGKSALSAPQFSWAA